MAIVKVTSLSATEGASLLARNSGDGFMSASQVPSDRVNLAGIQARDGELSSLQVLAIMDTAQQQEELTRIVRQVVIPKHAWKYTVKRGETLSHIALKFRVSKQRILSLNNLRSENAVRAGQIVYLPPDVQVLAAQKKSVIRVQLPAALVQALAPVGNWVTPVTGQRNGSLHSHNGVDVAAKCGEPVYAADDGIVIESANGWNGGYGNMTKLQNGVAVTLYGHMTDRFANVGDYIKKGTLIGTVGSTGKSTGCHLHFEVRGAQNFLKLVQ